MSPSRHSLVLIDGSSRDVRDREAIFAERTVTHERSSNIVAGLVRVTSKPDNTNEERVERPPDGHRDKPVDKYGDHRRYEPIENTRHKAANNGTNAKTSFDVKCFS